jgi:hypothetical protein
MSFETADPGEDPFLGWVQAALTRHSHSDPDAQDELAELRELATDLENEISPLASSDAKEVSPGSFVRVKAMDPRWLTRWLTFDPDRGRGVGQHPRRPQGHNAALIDNTTIGLVAGYIENQDPPSPLGLLDLANFVNNLVLRDKLVALHHPLGTGSVERTIRDEIRSPGPVETAILGAALLWIRQLVRADADSGQERTEAARTLLTILGRTAPSSKDMFAVPFERAPLLPQRHRVHREPV